MVKNALHIGVFNDSYLWMIEAKKLGYRIIAIHPIDIKDKYYYNIVKDLIDEFYIIDYMNFEKIIDIARNNKIEFCITHPCTNDASYAMGAVNSALGLKGITLNNTKHAASKLGWHEFLVTNNFPRAKWCVKYEKEMDLTMLEYPCIVKPNLGAGSQGIKKIYSAIELTNFMENPNYDNGYYLTKKYDYYIIQEYTEAKYLVGVNAAVHDGKLIVFAHYVKNLHTLSEQLRQPYFYYEDGIYPHDDNTYIHDENINLIQQLITDMKLDNAAIRFDLFMDEKKNIISFVELNLRPGSSHSATGFHEIFGYNITEQLIKLNTDFPIDFTKKHDTRWKFLYCKNFRFKPGKIKNITWPNLNEHVHHFSSQLKQGSIIPPVWNVATASLCGELLLLGETKEQLYMVLDQFIRDIEIVYE